MYNQWNGVRFCELGKGTADTKLVCIMIGTVYVKNLLLCHSCAGVPQKTYECISCKTISSNGILFNGLYVCKSCWTNEGLE